MSQIDIKARHRAREYAVQALYQWSITGQTPLEIEAQFIATSANRRVEHAYLTEIIHHIPQHAAEIDADFAPYLSRDIKELDPIELSILRLATYELRHRIDIPYQVVIDEALELTKTFGSVEGFKFVNGVLDKVARNLRTLELRS
jgi:N utilization substance protein B